MRLHKYLARLLVCLLFAVHALFEPLVIRQLRGQERLHFLQDLIDLLLAGLMYQRVFHLTRLQGMHLLHDYLGEAFITVAPEPLGDLIVHLGRLLPSLFRVARHLHLRASTIA